MYSQARIRREPTLGIWNRRVADKASLVTGAEARDGQSPSCTEFSGMIPAA